MSRVDRGLWLGLLGLLGWGGLGLAQPRAEPPAPRTLALVVGVGNYRPYPESPALPPLSYAESDARKMAAALRQANFGRLDRLRLLLEGEATKTALEAELRDLVRRTLRGDTVVFYYSGHGRPDSVGRASVMPYDAKATDEETWLALEAVQALILRNLAAGAFYLMIVDACFSGQSLPGTRSFAVPGSKAVPVAHFPPPSQRGTFLASSGADQVSWEDARVGGGVYTAFLTEALTGRADRDGDGRVSSAEAHHYALERVPDFTRDKGSAQVPRLFGAGDFTLALNPVVVAQGRLARLKVGGQISGPQFDGLVQWLEGGRLPPDLEGFLRGEMTAGRFAELVRLGALAGAPASPDTDPRLRRLGALRRAGRLSLAQFWAAHAQVVTGRAAWSLSRYLSGRLEEEAFLRRLAAGQLAGLPAR